MLPTIKQIREANGGLDNLTDFEIAQYQHQQYKAYVPDFNRFAEMVGVDPGTKWGNRLSASVDNYQANLSGVVEEVTGSTTMRNWREENERQARNAQQFAASQGAIMSMGDIESVGDVPEWVGGLAIDSAPYLLESAVGGLAVRGLSTGLRGTIAAGQAADASVDAIRAAQAARKAMAVRTTAGGVLASYPSAVGDILQNQRDEAGETNLGSAALGGIAYAGLNALGLEGAAARGGLRRGINLLDEGLDSAKGLRGAALRTAVNGTRVGVTEGLSETGQEMVNQSFGRMAVNPDQTLFNPEANDRYIESFAGGFALGGSMSAATGGWRRSEGYQPPAAPIDENGGVNLLNGQPLNPPAPVVNPGANAPLADVINQRVGLDLSRKPVKGYESAFEAAATEPSGVRAVDPATGQEYEMTQAEYLEREAAQRNDAFAQQLAAEQAALAEDKAKIEARNAVREEAKGLGITGSKGTDLYLELKQALEDGVISEADFRETRVQLGERKNNQVAKFIKAAYAQADATQTAKAQTEADAIAAVQNTTPEARSISDQEADAMAAEWEAALAEQAALAAKQGEVTDVQARDVQPATNTQVPERRNWSDAPGAVAGIAPDKTVEVGRSGRKKALTPAQVLEKIKKASPLNKMRILAATGMDMVADPTTGAPKLVISGNPMTLDEIADAESEATGKKVSKQAISQALADAGIDADVATRVASTDSGAVYTEADLGITPTDEGVADASGFRIEDTASKAANQGVIYDEVTGNAELTKVANALLQGKMTPEAAAQAVEGKTSKTTAARDVKPENAVTTAVEMPTTDTTKSDTVVTDLRDLTDATIEQNIRDILDGHPERENAAADWGSTRVPWDTLPDTFRADWIEQYGEIVDQFDGDLNQAAFRLLDAIQANIEDSYSDYIKYKGQQAPTGASPEALPGGESRVGMVAGAEEARPAIRDEGPAQAGRVEGPAAEPVENTSAEDQRVAQENAAKAKVVVKKKRTIQKPVDLEDPAVATTETVEAKPVAQPRNTTPGTVGATVAGQPVSANVGPGFTARDVVKDAPAKDAPAKDAPAKEASPVAAPDWAVGHARDTGGEVVFHNDEVALVSGFSVISGKHVYSGVLRSNGSRTRVDISSYTGNMFTPEQLTTLRAERERVIADEQAKMAANPDGPFSQGDSVAATGSVPVEAANYLRGLLKTLNMKGVRVFLLVPDDVRGGRDEYKLYGDFAAAGSAGLDANEDGSMRRFGPNPGDFYISMRPGMSAERVIETIAHEVGHVVERTAYDKADADTKAAIRKEYEAWLADTKRMTAPEIIQALRNRATAEAHSANVDEDNLLSPYWTSFSEWFADNVSRWATTAEKPMSLVDKFFSAVAATIRKLAASVTGRTYVPNPVVAKFLDGMTEGTVKTVPWSDDTAASQSAAPTQSVAQQLGPQYAKAETALTRAIGDLKTAAVKYGAFTRDLIDQAAKYMPAARQYLANYEAVATDRTRMEQKVDAILERFGALSTHERTRVNELIRSSTMSKEWAFKPDWLKDAKYDENSTLAVQFRALTPAQRGVVQDVFRHGHETLEAMQKAVKDNVNSEFDVLIKGFKDAGNDAEAAKAEARKVKALQEFSSMLEMNGNWPYAPLRRFGDHVVVAKSAAYRAAEKAKDAAAIKKLEADENHYYVEFFESRGEARKKVADMQASGKYAGGVVENFNKGEANEQLYGGRDTFNAFRRLRNLVNETGGASLTEPANATINSLMNDLYLSLLGERSARQAERNRKNTAGADRDMMRAFATKGRADAHFIASLRFGGQVQEDLLKMKDQADNSEVGTRELRREFFNEILARHTMQMDFQSTPVVDKVMSFSSFFQLLVNPAYYLQNVMQPWVMSLPMLAGKHGYGKSWSALSKAYRDLLPLLKDGNFSKGDYDALPRDVQAIVKDLAARGRIEISLEHDLGRWRSNADDGVATRYFVAAREKLRKANTQIEMVNRLATAIAAARLEGVGNAKAATDYADRVIIGTHGDYNAFNAPRLMRTPLGRMATQFRKFQLIQITMYTKLISDAFKGASVQERQAARLALAYNVGHMAALGGAMGLPGFQLFSMILGAVFGDDDEPDDAEATMRRVLGNGPVADMLIRGAPNAAGVDISGKVGSGNMLSLFPYSDWDVSSRDGYMNLLAAAAGPFVGGLMPRMAEGIGNMSQGDYLKGLEKFLPGAVGNAIKGTRFAVEGVTTTKGDMVMSPDEVTWVDGLFQAAGLPTSTLTERNFRSSAEYKASKFFDEKSSEIKRSYVEAFQDNDTEAMAEARQEWLDMQATRRRLGMTVQPLSQLIKAPQERRKRERAAVGGVATDRETQGFVRQFTE